MSETRKAFERLKKIWPGAKWGAFARGWIGRRRTSAQRANYIFMGAARRFFKGKDE